MKSSVSIMPCLDIRGTRVMKGIHFKDLIDAGDPLELAVMYERSGADRLGYLDIAATVEKRRPAFAMLQQVAGAVKIPVTYGGGLKTLADVEAALSAGARKIGLATVAYRDPDFVPAAVKEFGGERIVLALDADRNLKLPSQRELYVDGGRTKTGVDAVEFARKMADTGVGEILPTSKAGDGYKRGYDLDLTRQIADATQLPTVASGGAGKLVHFLEAVKEGHACTVLAASVFHFGTFTVQQVKTFLAGQGVRVHNARTGKM